MERESDEVCLKETVEQLAQKNKTEILRKPEISKSRIFEQQTHTET
jgi:hypothetical protein